MTTPQNTAALANPLGLTVEYRDGVTPLHEAWDGAKVADLAESMERDGWTGAPIVADGELRDAGQDKAYTGSHRLAAWAEVSGTPVPCVYVEALCEAVGIDWDALMDEHERDSYEAAVALCILLPEDVREAYGFDAGGMA